MVMKTIFDALINQYQYRKRLTNATIHDLLFFPVEMSNLTVAMCWELVTIKKDKLNSIGAAIYQKPESNDCYEQRKHNQPPMCKSDDDPNAAWS